MNKKQALKQVGEMKNTTDSTTYPTDSSSENNWTDRRPNGTVFYHFSDAEIKKAKKRNEDPEWNTNLPWDEAHIVSISDDDDDTIWSN